MITIVIPNYNGIKFLPECLNALKPEVQTLGLASPDKAEPYEVLIVDNGSTDGSLELLERDYPWVKCVKLSTNTGFCHAVNVGIEASNAEYVLLLNNDTKAYPGFVQNLYSAIAGRRKCFSVSAQMLMWQDETMLDGCGDLYTLPGWALARGKGQQAIFFERGCRIFSACGGAAIYRRSILDEIGLFDEAHFAYLEDLDIGYRARLHGYYNYYEPSAKVVHYGSAVTGSRYNERKVELAAANSIYVIWKNMPPLQVVVNFIFLLPGFVIKQLFFIRKGLGGAYRRGIKAGLARRRDPALSSRKIRLGVKGLGRYLAIEWELIRGTFQILHEGL